jgi:cyclic beta-1,2-glucan synthetase
MYDARLTSASARWAVAEPSLLRRLKGAAPLAPWDTEETIRSELFSHERLEQHAESLAAAQPVTLRAGPGRSLTMRLAQNEATLHASHRAIAQTVAEGGAITPSAEWLLDNYHIVEQQVREIRQDLPPSYYRQLPKLATGPFAGYPRIFGIAWAYVAHTDSRFEPDSWRRFVRAYQRVQPLTIGELWAVAITLRIVLVENLRRASRRIVLSRQHRLEADALADQVLGAETHDGESINQLLERYDDHPLPLAFAVQLVHRLREQDAKVQRVLDWLEERLAAQGSNIDDVVHDEHQSQGGTNVTVRNIITSMRLISDVDWSQIFESVSLVDEALREGSDFAAMDFPTRNLYRNAIEELARGARLPELEVARRAIAFAGDAGGATAVAAAGDPGHWLIAGGRRAFEKRIGFRVPPRHWPRRFNTALGLRGLILVSIAIAATLLSLPLTLLYDTGLTTTWHYVLLGALGAIGALDAAIALIQPAITREVHPTTLPALALRGGIPAEFRTMVVVPTLLTTLDAVEQQIERLEVHYLGSSEGELYFALLSDWTDAGAAFVEGDDALLDAAAAGIARLNATHGPGPAGDRFLLLHRHRTWNERDRQWLGWERKRGKLHELNRLLRGRSGTTFLDVDGKPPSVPDGVRYVITLDADTRMPREAARRLIGKMAHPLNRARFDETFRRVVEGYGVLQPRITPAMPSGGRGSVFHRVFSSASGIDPYAFAVSDVHQDLFGEGSYTGKGIYDVDAFERALDGRVPENAVLSHDLFEGIFARAAFVSDVELIEDFPSRYDEASVRQHRWVRGDWQLLPWLFGRGRAALGPRAGAIPRVGRWRMIDNLRRSLTAPANVLALIAGWALPLDGALVWSAFVVFVATLPALLPVFGGLLPARADVPLANHLRAVGADLGTAIAQVVLMMTFLAHQACLMVDAIVRTLYRLLVSHRHMLDWVTAAQARSSAHPALADWYRDMSGALWVAGAAAIVIVAAGSGSWPVAVPFIVAWCASPAIAYRVSREPRARTGVPLAAADAHALRLIARRTWRFFETFVTAENHALPPDNFQETPRPTVAHRTSPTNIGVYLLSVVTARDFGWIGTTEMLDRLEATLASMALLTRFRGHFLNWYDTADLRPLEPQYVSSVDSGNLAGHLIALANACSELARRRAPDQTALAGAADAVAIARLALAALPNDRRTQTTTLQQLEGELDVVAALLESAGTESGELRTDVDARDDLAARLHALTPLLTTLVDIARTHAGERADEGSAEVLFWTEAAQRSIASHVRDLGTQDASLVARLDAIEATARRTSAETEFGFLLDRERNLLSIGYRVADGQLDPSCYDLLASEARLASFIAIAKGDVPSRHWFRLGRTVTLVEGGAALVSWSGSMFEYLMPSLVMRAPTGSLLEHTSRFVVRRQIAYAAGLGIPWGISESACNVRDIELTYQYSSFGIPGLGLKRGLAENVVIAPYATALAAMVDPSAAAANFERLTQAGALGRYGFYEALDYTPARVPEGSDVALVRTFMAHHQGMTLVALSDALLNGVMRARFHAESMVQATELLLQERKPREVSMSHPRTEAAHTAPSIVNVALPAPRHIRSPHTAATETQLLSNGRYTVMLTAAGSGYSRWHDLAITRWLEDPTRDDWGAYLYVRDVQSGAVWSAGYQPIGTEPESYEATFTEDRAVFARRDGSLTTSLEVVVSSEDDAEVRRLCITNAGTRVRELEVTSYAEIVLAPAATDTAHPAFAKLFVQTEYLPRRGILLATRRRREPSEPEVWVSHFVIVEGSAIGTPEVETDRARFLGRGHDVRRPVAVLDGLPLSGTTGTVLDAVLALRRRVRVPPGATVRMAYWTAVAASREQVMDLTDKHYDVAAFERAAMLAWTQAQVQFNHLGIDAEESDLFQRLAGSTLHADPALRAAPDTLRRGAGAPPALWSQGISGDVPIVLVRIDNMDDLPLVRQMLRAHEYWHLKQLAIDLVFLNERGASYVQDLQIALETLVRASRARPQLGGSGQRGAIFVLRADLIDDATRDVLLYRARAVLTGRRGTLSEQLNRPVRMRPRDPVARRSRPAIAAPPGAVRRDLEFFNGLGGFADDGREYVTVLPPGRSLPAPWVNVIANPAFGFQVSVEGSGYTWAESSRENQLTPWSNDPVSDRPGEVLYVRDDESGELWTPTALPIRDPSSTYVVAHGHGYSRFEHTSRDIALTVLQLVPLEDPVKIMRLTIRNESAATRRLSITAYVEWVLGSSRSAAQLSIVTEIDQNTGALLARNPWNSMFGSRVAFLDLGGEQTSCTADRREFLGKYGTLDNPAALAPDTSLSGRVGAGLDACAALQAKVEVPPGGERHVIVLLGQAASAEAAEALVVRYRERDVDSIQRAVVAHWDALLGATRVKTPDRAMDVLLNQWALYQTLGCRMWARAGFYQAGGAYGFRDQLQDSMALVFARPDIARTHLLRAASRQFVDGDVQHWWLPQTGHGVRTHNSDDRVWLVYATVRYIVVTGDTTVLDERITFLDGPRLAPDAHDAYFQPQVVEPGASLFEHCARALDSSLATGAHGLPLIGTGDWNDGMNRVGEHGRGESVWLGWMLHATLTSFARLAAARDESSAAARWNAHAAALRDAIERNAWDGEWYRRGYFDDGTALGSYASEECRIDSIAQSWAVISGAADPERAARAMQSMDRHLIRRGDDLAVLFTPPFDGSSVDPGYIKGYPPGIRENGGQYVHASAWAVIAYAELGDGNKAVEIFSFLNPIVRSSTRALIQRYKVEPYVVAADVYSEPPHVGRGGWTWYTGAAGWLYRAALEAILGIRIENDTLRLVPSIPREWPEYRVELKYRSARYDIVVENPHGSGRGIATLTLDGAELPVDPPHVPLCDDGRSHRVRARLRAPDRMT